MPRGKAVLDLRSEARRFTNLGLNTLVGIARNGKAEPSRVAAAIHILDRGWGKADQNHTVDGDIKITIRHILEHIDEKPVVIEGKEVLTIDVEPEKPDDAG